MTAAAAAGAIMHDPGGNLDRACEPPKADLGDRATPPAPGSTDFRDIVDRANDIVMVVESDGPAPATRIVYVNDAFTRLTGYSAAEAIGRSPCLLDGPETDPAMTREIGAAIRCGNAIRRRLLRYAKDGRPFWVEISLVPLAGGSGPTRQFASIERDISGDIRRERELQALALLDPLTNLPSRRAAEEFLAREVARARRNALPLSVIMLDLDRFKAVNDGWGHEVGDRLLIAVADVLSRSLRRYDFGARLGGDEFILVLPATLPGDAGRIAERLRGRVRSEARVAAGPGTIGVTCSGGLAWLMPQDATAASLTQRADRALYLAKRNGRNRIWRLETASEAGTVASDAGGLAGKR